MKVYVLTQGEYSDYHIEYVCLDEKVARDYIDRRKALIDEAREFGQCYDEYPMLEEYEVAEEIRPEQHLEWTAYGNVRDGLGNIRAAACIKVEPGPTKPERRENSYMGQGLSVLATCADRVAAIKSVKDRLASVIATAYEGEA
jgi:hypothetical protein